MKKAPIALFAATVGLSLAGCSRNGLGSRSAIDAGLEGGLHQPSTAGAGGAGSVGTGADAASTGASGGSGGMAIRTSISFDAAAYDARPDVRPNVGPDVGPDGVLPISTTSDCFIATRTDTCCRAPFVVSRNEMDEDPCVQPYMSPTIPPECAARRPANCATVDCAFVVPLTRVVGRVANGDCQYLSECESVEDCLWVVDARQCCGCPSYLPRALVAPDPCFQAPEQRSSQCPNELCASAKCDKLDAYCPSVSVTCSSSTTAGLKTCVERPQ